MRTSGTESVRTSDPEGYTIGGRNLEPNQHVAASPSLQLELLHCWWHDILFFLFFFPWERVGQARLLGHCHLSLPRLSRVHTETQKALCACDPVIYFKKNGSKGPDLQRDLT